ncbi:MAG: patatin family protein [Clostridiales bacterium]|nr:patatin family protein [Clostridiales bacterium]
MKKGLVLEGGAMRGLFTAGVMDVFLENNIRFDGAVGVSAGAAFGCNYKSKQIGRVLRYNKRFCNYWKYSGFRSLLLTGDIYGAKFCYYDIPFELDKFDCETFRNNPMDFYVVATDVHTGKAVYHNMTDADNENMEWMRASASMPMVSKPVRIGDSEYLDGGMADSIPLEFMQKKGFGKNVVILTQPEDYVKHQFSAIPLIRFLTRKYPAVKKAMEERPSMYNAQAAYVKVCEEKGDTLVIRPRSPLNVGSIEHDPDELQRVYNEGRKEALRRIEEVKEFTAC